MVGSCPLRQPAQPAPGSSERWGFRQSDGGPDGCTLWAKALLLRTAPKWTAPGLVRRRALDGIASALATTRSPPKHGWIVDGLTHILEQHPRLQVGETELTRSIFGSRGCPKGHRGDDGPRSGAMIGQLARSQQDDRRGEPWAERDAAPRECDARPTLGEAYVKPRLLARRIGPTAFARRSRGIRASRCESRGENVGAPALGRQSPRR